MRGWSVKTLITACRVAWQFFRLPLPSASKINPGSKATANKHAVVGRKGKQGWGGMDVFFFLLELCVGFVSANLIATCGWCGGIMMDLLVPLYPCNLSPSSYTCQREERKNTTDLFYLSVYHTRVTWSARWRRSPRRPYREKALDQTGWRAQDCQPMTFQSQSGIFIQMCVWHSGTSKV